MNRKKRMWAIALAGCMLGGMQAYALADGTPGLTIFSGVDREDNLDFHLDFGGRAGGWDRYRLRVPGKKMTQGAAKFFIVYPDYYTGKFDLEAVEVRVKNQSLPLREVIWDEESRIIEISMEEPITESNEVEIVFSNVKNPNSGGTFYFQGQVLAPGEIPIRLHLGTWILSISR
ncbi:MAG: DUF2808 domain-containing protein [Gomphosphaeria aponina SAG 52.96 = DSM 107014]|uniref:DUF2808 domain-containing protein n=1 Tax=Gomphosphaeria aponina SAG 52.96 = DSM 107014 TaxID=1521640 RepID=A0A941JSR9_9CHRO|nr:DUF2808 domain-containing protein [Gomphosphaeria aponina SAG 52.96 = DSM 107014]